MDGIFRSDVTQQDEQAETVRADDRGRLCHPPLTTVPAPVEQVGRVLIDLILDTRDTQIAPRIVLSGRPRMREPTDPVKVA
jgi:DNA-binding LacI/PurR family transcriptional regulator